MLNTCFINKSIEKSAKFLALQFTKKERLDKHVEKLTFLLFICRRGTRTLNIMIRVSNASGFYLRAIAHNCAQYRAIPEQLRAISRNCAQQNCDWKP